MSILLVGGVPIPISPSGASRPRLDMADRARAFDGTYRASVTGNAKRDWNFSTPPIPRAFADSFQTVLATIGSQTCSGELLLGNGNLLIRSEEKNNAAWTKSDVTIDSDVITAPNGTLTGDKIKETATTAQHNVFQGITGLTDNTVYTYSDFVYPAERNWLTVGIIGKDGGSRYTYFNLATGARGSSAGSPLAAGIERGSAESGWWRVWIAATVASGGFGYGPFLGLATADGTNNYLGTAGSGIYSWGAQLELGSYPSAYSPTTTVAVTSTVSCFTEILDWTPVKTPQGHRVVLSFMLHEA